jgi:hypothetical protein
MRIRRYITNIKSIKKIFLKSNDKKEHNYIKKYNKMIETFYKNLIKKNKVNDFEKFKNDFFDILDSKYCVYNHIKKFLNIIKNKYILKNFIGINFREIQDEHYNILFNKNDDINYNINDDKINQILLLKINNIYSDFIVELIHKIYKKFNKIDEDFIVDLFTYYTLDIDKVLKYLKNINFIFKKSINIKKLHNLSDDDYFYLLNSPDIEYILTSNHIITNFSSNNYDNIDKVINTYLSKTDYNDIFSIIINSLIQTDKYGNFNSNYYINNATKWILNKQIPLNLNIKIKICVLQLISMMYNFIDNNYILDNNEYIIKVLNYEPDPLFFNLINNIINKKEFLLQQLIEADELIIYMIFKRFKLRRKKIYRYKNIYTNKNINLEKYDYFLDYHDMAIYTGLNMIDIDIFKSFINKNRIQFINIFINNVKKVTNINDIINCKLFHNKNKIFTLDEKINILKKIYSGKIKSSELELFILNNNELACHFIKNIPINKKFVKYAMSVANLKLIETLCDLKYNFTTDDLLYITSDLYLEEILNCINKYNTINFMGSLDWYYHIKYILNINNNELNILKVIYNDDNQDLRDLFYKKIEEDTYKDNFNELNNLDFNEFCIYVKKNNIILNKYDTYRLNCLKKRLFILNSENYIN